METLIGKISNQCPETTGLHRSIDDRQYGLTPASDIYNMQSHSIRFEPSKGAKHMTCQMLLWFWTHTSLFLRVLVACCSPRTSYANIPNKILDRFRSCLLRIPTWERRHWQGRAGAETFLCIIQIDVIFAFDMNGTVAISIEQMKSASDIIKQY